MVPISPCTQVFDGVLRQVPKQDMLVTTPPFTWWFKDLPTYTTYVFRQMSVPRRSGILKLTTMPGQPDEIEVPRECHYLILIPLCLYFSIAIRYYGS